MIIYKISNVQELDIEVLQAVDHQMNELLKSDRKLRFDEDGVQEIIDLLNSIDHVEVYTKASEIKDASWAEIHKRWLPIDIKIHDCYVTLDH